MIDSLCRNSSIACWPPWLSGRWSLRKCVVGSVVLGLPLSPLSIWIRVQLHESGRVGYHRVFHRPKLRLHGMDERHVTVVLKIPKSLVRLRLTLGRLLLVLGAFCVCLGLVANRVHQAGRQQAAVAAVFATGGSVCYEGSLHYRAFSDGEKGFASSQRTPPGIPKDTLLRKIMGDDYFDTVVEVTFGSKHLKNAMNRLGDLTSVRMIVFNDAPTREVDLEQLTSLPCLETVVVKGASKDTLLLSALTAALPKCRVLDHSDDTLLQRMIERAGANVTSTAR